MSRGIERGLTVTAVFLIGLTIWGLRSSRISLWEILGGPLKVLLGSPRHLDTTVLELSENDEPFSAASRKLLKPFGRLQLLRTFDLKDEKSDGKNRSPVTVAPD